MKTVDLIARNFKKRNLDGYIWYEKSIKGVKLVTQDWDSRAGNQNPNWFIFMPDTGILESKRIRSVNKLDSLINALK